MQHHVISREELSERLEPYRQRSGLVDDFEAPMGLYLQAASPREIIARMLRNLKESHQSQQDWVRLIAVLDRLVLVRGLGLTTATAAWPGPPKASPGARSATWKPTWRTPLTRWTAKPLWRAWPRSGSSAEPWGPAAGQDLLDHGVSVCLICAQNAIDFDSDRVQALPWGSLSHSLTGSPARERCPTSA